MTLLHRLTLATLTFVVLLTSQVGGALFLDWRVEDNFNRLDIDGIEEDVAIAGFSVPGGLFFSHESAGVKLRGLDDASQSGARLVAIPVHSRAGMPDETGHPHVSRPVRLYRLRTVEERSTPLSRFEATGDGVFEGFVDLPETFGVYVLAIERADGSRRWLSSIAHVVEPTAPAGDVPHGMAMASFLGHPRTLNPDRVDEHVEIFRRLGIRFVRLGIRWVDVERRQGQRDWDKYDRAFEAYKRAGIDVVVTTYVHPHWTLPFGTPTPSARSAKKPDSVAHPDFDAEYEAFIAEMVRRYRHPGGPGGLWGVEVWNEPWEGGSISMYNADMLRYRELCLATERAVDSVDPTIHVLGSGSTMNTEDKFLSDGDTSAVRVFDYLTDHYTTLQNGYNGMLSKKLGIPFGYTEDWGATSEALNHQAHFQKLSFGAAFTSPWDGHKLMVNHGSTQDELLAPRAPTAATAAWNAIVADRSFKRIVFHDHLPFLYQFGEDDDAVFVLVGKLFPYRTANDKDLMWQQAIGFSAPDGTLRLAADGLEVRDIVGNVVASDGEVELPLSYEATFLKSSRGADAVIKAVREATIEGMTPVQLTPLTVTPRDDGWWLPVEIHNVLNRPVAGSVTVVRVTDGEVLLEEPSIHIDAGHSGRIDVPMPDFAGESVPVRVVFESDAGRGVREELVQPTLIARAARGDDPTRDAFRIDVVEMPERAGVITSMDAAWLPFLETEQRDGEEALRRGWLKMAWDEDHLHVHAAVDDESLDRRPRLSERDDEDYFHGSGSSDVLDRYAEFEQKVGRGESIDWSRASYVYRRDPRHTLAWVGDVLQVGIDLDVASDRHIATHDLAYPAVLPPNYVGVPDTDIELCLYPTQDGQSELWRAGDANTPRIHFFPRQPLGQHRPGPVTSATHDVQHEDGKTHFRMSIPWSVLGLDAPPVAGSDIGVTFALHGEDQPSLHFGHQQAIVQTSGLSLRPFWGDDTLSAAVRWRLLDAQP